MLLQADWSTYYAEVTDGLTQHGRDAQRYHRVLDAAAQQLPIPWETGYFEDIGKRRIMIGIKDFGWLGNVGASGHFRNLLARRGADWPRIIQAVNAMARLDAPIPVDQLHPHLESLVSLGNTLKVWSRLLALVRPDLYCSVASDCVRRNLSEMLDIPADRFSTMDGYAELIGMIHLAPWFNSAEPAFAAESAIWQRRVAFMDAILYLEGEH